MKVSIEVSDADQFTLRLTECSEPPVIFERQFSKSQIQLIADLLTLWSASPATGMTFLALWSDGSYSVHGTLDPDGEGFPTQVFEGGGPFMANLHQESTDESRIEITSEE